MKPQRRELLELFNEFGALYPNWRFGQLVENVSAWAGDNRAGIVGEVSDEQMIRAAREHLAIQAHSGVKAGAA